ncbi:AN1-type zinc finger protein 1-like [Babylonia areolata]|uniref:AN1-type zinc finger protein 1-like n=1 Tax=Babylonia areolata TaxID=304850 RepID=UPI003FD529F2
MAELPHIGKHCYVESCNQLDFLPFDCDGCGNTFCLQHKGKDDHQCDKHLLQTASVDYKGPKGFSCSVKECSHRELTPVACEHCHLNFCLSHRHQQDHQCTELKTSAVPNEQTAQHVANILAGRQPPAARKPLKSLKARQTAARVALMKLKGKAAGDKGIPDTERIYFTVALPLASKLPPRALFFSKRWTVGRVIDSIADSAGLHNPNNTGAAQKLRLFAGDSGDLMAVESRMEEVMTDATGVFSGSSLILELVAADTVCLPQPENYRTVL